VVWLFHCSVTSLMLTTVHCLSRYSQMFSCCAIILYTLCPQKKPEHF